MILHIETTQYITVIKKSFIFFNIWKYLLMYCHNNLIITQQYFQQSKKIQFFKLVKIKICILTIKINTF
jgi:hypothetical protein